MKFFVTREDTYNLQTGGIGGYHNSEETRKLKSLSSKNKPKSELHRKNMSNGMKGRKGRVGIPLTFEHVQKLRLAKLGTHLSTNHKESLSRALKGSKRPQFTDEHREKLRAAKLGKIRGPRSQEIKDKISETKRRRHQEKLQLAVIQDTQIL